MFCFSKVIHVECRCLVFIVRRPVWLLDRRMDAPSRRLRLIIGGRRLETLRPQGDAEPSADKPETEIIEQEMAYLGTVVIGVKVRQSWWGRERG